MKNFKTLLESVDKETERFDALVRAGLINKAQLRRVHQILDKMSQEKASFTSSDRQIINNLLVKVINLITKDEKMFQRSRQLVRNMSEEFEIDENDLIKENQNLSEMDITDIPMVTTGLPPAILVFRRKSYRLYPNNVKVALYHNDKINKFITVPFADRMSLESKEVSNMEVLKTIVENNSSDYIMFDDLSHIEINVDLAEKLLKLHESLNIENQEKLEKMISENEESFNSVVKFFGDWMKSFSEFSTNLKENYSSEEFLDESTNIRKVGRVKIIRRRIRGGKVQKMVKKSAIKGFTLKGGKLKRISAMQKIKMKLGQRKAKIKRRAKLAQSLRKRKLSLRKRKALGIR